MTKYRLEMYILFDEMQTQVTVANTILEHFYLYCETIILLVSQYLWISSYAYWHT